MTPLHRVGLFALAALVLIAAFVLLRPADEGDDAGPHAPTPSATPAQAEPASTPTPEPIPVLAAGEVTRIGVHKGDLVRFRVRTQHAEEVHVHGYDLLRGAEPGKPASFRFRARLEGIFEIELEQSGVQVGELRVEP
jgi:hypothetical protein